MNHLDFFNLFGGEMFLRFSAQVFYGVFVFLLAFLLQEIRIRRMSRKLRRLARERKEAEVVFIVSNRERIRPHAERYLAKRFSGSGHLPAIYECHREELFPANPGEWHHFLNQVRRRYRELTRLAPTRILLFTNVPVAMGVMLGALLDNGPEVIVHHFFNGTYAPVGTLSRETVDSYVPDITEAELAGDLLPDEMGSPPLKDTPPSD